MMQTMVVIVVLVLLAAPACDRYKHVLTNVERVDSPEDALVVYHDKARSVTCYESFNGGGVSCVADIQLRRP